MTDNILPPAPPDTAVDETAVSQWQETHPAAYRIYWTLRAAMEEKDGKKKAIHHRAALLAIHESFPSRPERERLGLPVTIKQLADLLGVSDRVMRNYRERYRGIFGTTQVTMSDAFINTYYGRVLEAMSETASIVGREGNPDRVLFTKMAGLTEKIDLRLDVSKLTDEELEALDSQL